MLNFHINSGTKLTDFKIRVGTQNAVDNNPICYFYDDVVPSAASVKITCNKPLFGRYVSMQKMNPGAEASDILAICEVKVFGIEGE